VNINSSDRPPLQFLSALIRPIGKGPCQLPVCQENFHLNPVLPERQSPCSRKTNGSHCPRQQCIGGYQRCHCLGTGSEPVRLAAHPHDSGQACQTTPETRRWVTALARLDGLFNRTTNPPVSYSPPHHPMALGSAKATFKHFGHGAVSRTQPSKRCDNIALIQPRCDSGRACSDTKSPPCCSPSRMARSTGNGPGLSVTRVSRTECGTTDLHRHRAITAITLLMKIDPVRMPRWCNAATIVSLRQRTSIERRGSNANRGAKAGISGVGPGCRYRFLLVRYSA